MSTAEAIPEDNYPISESIEIIITDEAFEKEKCLNCPLQIYCMEESAIISQIRKDDSSAKAWITFGKNVLNSCSAEKPKISKRRKYLIFGEKLTIVDCQSRQAKNHRNKLTRMILPNFSEALDIENS